MVYSKVIPLEISAVRFGFRKDIAAEIIGISRAIRISETMDKVRRPQRFQKPLRSYHGQNYLQQSAFLLILGARLGM
ncbi:MAG: hypothetical protein HUU32_21985 [Calditrichaceae bacterium]|nr:hypothetical protein [Calditrichaceae bacterium]